MSIWYLVAGLVVLFAIQFFMVIYVLPSAKEKRKKARPQPQEDNKEAQEVIVRHEKHIQSLKQEIVKLEHQQMVLEKQIAIEKAKSEKLQEKLLQERDWISKEGQVVDKKSKELQKFKDDLAKVQESFSKEHMENLRLLRELETSKKEIESMHQTRRKADLDFTQLHTKYDGLRQEYSQLRSKNMELAKKQEDTQWIAKTEYDKILRELKEKEKELERLKREL